MKSLSLQQQAYVFAGLAILFWSTVASAFKFTLQFASPLQIIFIATLTSLFVLLIILLLQKKLSTVKRYVQQQGFACFVLGLLNPSLYYWVLFNAYDQLSAQEAMAINYSWPVVLVLLSVVFLKQRIRPAELMGVVLSYIGVVIIATKGNPLQLDLSHPLGVGLALLSTVIWSLYWILNIKLGKSNITQSGIATLFISFLFAFPIVALTTLYFSPFESLTWQGLLGGIYVGMFEMGITFVVWSAALRLSESTAKVSNLIFITPFLSLVVIAVWLDEKIQLSTMAGLLVIMCGIGLHKFLSKSFSI